jgi:hypothetical protein
LVFVGGSHVERKPDVTGVCYERLEVSERLSVDNLMKDGPDGDCFWWTEILFFFEFKLICKELLYDLVQDAVTSECNLSIMIY